MERDRIEMSIKEIKRVGIIQRVIEGKLTQQAASRLIGVVDRQIRRIVKRYRTQGEKGLLHRLRGIASNRRHDETLKRRVLTLYQEKYGDFGPTLAHEKLLEKHNIQIGCQTLRRWLIEAKLWEIRTQKKIKQHEWRQRKECFGEMIQLDGSHHDWLEGRGPKLVLMGLIDDATSRVSARFHDYEGTVPVMDSFLRYVKQYGLPKSVYLDRHSAYFGSGLSSLEEDLLGRRRPESQFERALRQLGVDLIHAYSPQAKGRIERLFGTFQDRLIKEMRLADIKTKEGANQFLEKYLPEYNRRFCVPAKTEVNLHRSESMKCLKQILSIQSKHALRNDNTIRHENRFYQILKPWKYRRPKQIVFQERLDGKLCLTHEGHELPWRLIPEPPKQSNLKPKSKLKPHQLWKPPMSHPYKRLSFQNYVRTKQHQNNNQNRTFLTVSN